MTEKSTLRPLDWDDWLASKRMVALNQRSVYRAGSAVIYWVQNAQRGVDNEALNAAIALADDLDVGVVVYFALHARLPHATARGYHFLLDGLRDMEAALRLRKVPLVVRAEPPLQGVLDIVRDSRAAAVVTDRSALRLGRELRADVASRLEIGCFEVDSENVLPLHLAGHAFTSARALRSFQQQYLEQWLWPRHDPDAPKRHDRLDGIDLSEATEKILAKLDVDTSVPPISELVGGASEADKRLDSFLSGNRGESEWFKDHSRLSAYIRFGQIAPATVIRELRGASSERGNRVLEEVLTRRELAANYTWYTPSYWTIDGLPGWATKTLKQHADERKGHSYTRKELAEAKTDDPLWNAAQLELVHTGRIQSYVRMYWGKRLVEWFPDAAKGLATALWLNDRYALDGRSPNGVANIQWCFGLHDRPFPERAKFGVVRPLGTGGVKRHIDMDGYMLWATSLGGDDRRDRAFQVDGCDASPSPRIFGDRRHGCRQ